MTIFVITELQDANSRRNGKVVEAKNLSEAKRKATKMQVFHGTVMEIANEYEAVLAVKKGGRWTDR